MGLLGQIQKVLLPLSVSFLTVSVPVIWAQEHYTGVLQQLSTGHHAATIRLSFPVFTITLPPVSYLRSPLTPSKLHMVCQPSSSNPNFSATIHVPCVSTVPFFYSLGHDLCKQQDAGCSSFRGHLCH